MRLWSKQIINYLPKKQLLSQWREIIAIIGLIKKYGFPNHILVNIIMDYPLNHLASYAKLVIDEMESRGYKINNSKIQYVYEFCGKPNVLFQDIYYNWHDNLYLKICIYNLYEKYLRGGISDEEWACILLKFDNLLHITTI